MSRRTLRVVTPSRSASSVPLQTGRLWSRSSRRSTRAVVPEPLSDVVDMARAWQPLRTETAQKAWAGRAKTTTQTPTDCTSALVYQAARHGTNQLRPRPEEPTDEEY